MLRIKLTKNYTGFTISGDFEDLNKLYDVRHAHQGDREYELVDNGLYDFKRNYFNIKKRDVADNNIYYSFNVLVLDILLDVVLIKNFINKQKDNVYNSNISYVNHFYSLVIEALKEMLTDIRYNKIKGLLNNAYINPKTFIPQWSISIDIAYIKSNKQKREKEFMHTIDKLVNSYKYKEYNYLREDVLDFCKKHNCFISNVEYDEYPNEIEW